MRPRQRSNGVQSPLLMSLPLLDWTVHPGPPPSLRFQVDKRAQYTSSRAIMHPLRSALQYYYRLEDTADREMSQVFTKHKPWQTDREVDLSVRRWYVGYLFLAILMSRRYGQYPTGLVVDELWILQVDDSHVVTFSSNQTWKARFPPLQLPSRIREVSFRAMRNNRRHGQSLEEYNGTIHLIACLHGAVGMLHRSFWSEISPGPPLPCAERYAGYLSTLVSPHSQTAFTVVQTEWLRKLLSTLLQQLLKRDKQYRLHRKPNAKLVSDLLQAQDELNIIMEISRKQHRLMDELVQVFQAMESGTLFSNQINDSAGVRSSSSFVTHDQLDAG